MGDIWDILPGLGDKLAAHVVLSASAIGLAMVIALPLAVWASRSAIVSRLALSLASLVQTIPALALLALFFPLLVLLRNLTGLPVPSLGLLPSLLALALYALLPLLRGDGEQYTTETGLAPLAEVANSVKKLPREWINEDGVSMNFQFLRYAQPLIQGEITLPHDGGVPVFARLEKVRVDKVLPAYEV